MIKNAPLVIDASVALSYVWQEIHSVKAHALFSAGLNHSVQLVAPELWSLECGDGCWKRMRRGLASDAEAWEGMRLIDELPVARLDVSHLGKTAFELALHAGITAYDAMYVITADYVGGTLVTADAKLIRALTGARWDTPVMHLEDW